MAIKPESLQSSRIVVVEVFNAGGKMKVLVSNRDENIINYERITHEGINRLSRRLFLECV